MKDKIKFYLDDKEKVLIINSLNELKQTLIDQDLSPDSVDEILSKISDKPKLELDTIDSKIVIKALDDTRKKLKDDNQPHTDINDVLLKLIDETDKKKLVLRKIYLGNARRH